MIGYYIIICYILQYYVTCSIKPEPAKCNGILRTHWNKHSATELWCLDVKFNSFTFLLVTLFIVINR